MVNIKEIKESVSNDGAKLIYQSLDGLNWKQITCKDINLNIDLIICSRIMLLFNGMSNDFYGC